MVKYDPKPLIPLPKALTWVFLSTVIFSGLPALGFLYYQYHQSRMAADDRFLIQGIVQTGPDREALPTVYLEELLELSTDQPKNLYHLDEGKAETLLLASPVIRQARVKKLPPKALFVDYTVFYPIARLGELKNLAVTRDGILFPLEPFFAPSELPEIYLGMDACPCEEAFGKYYESQKLTEALAILTLFHKARSRSSIQIEKLDVEAIDDPSYGSRQVVLSVDAIQDVMLQDGRQLKVHNPHILRLHHRNYVQGLANYFQLEKALQKKLSAPPPEIEGGQGEFWNEALVIDFRLDQLAFFPDLGLGIGKR